jgi:hypothetical protein
VSSFSNVEKTNDWKEQAQVYVRRKELREQYALKHSLWGQYQPKHREKKIVIE